MSGDRGRPKEERCLYRPFYSEVTSVSVPQGRLGSCRSTYKDWGNREALVSGASPCQKTLLGLGPSTVAFLLRVQWTGVTPTTTKRRRGDKSPSYEERSFFFFFLLGVVQR